MVGSKSLMPSQTYVPRRESREILPHLITFSRMEWLSIIIEALLEQPRLFCMTEDYICSFGLKHETLQSFCKQESTHGAR